MKVVGFLVVALSLGACVALNPDRPCEEPEINPRCPLNYTCVAKKRFPWDQNTTELCVAIGAKAQDEPCSDPEECSGFELGTATCADQSRTCPATGTPADPQGCDFRCRPICRAGDHEACGPDRICFPGAGNVTGVCQVGECGESRRFCPSGLECFWFKGGDTGGVCYAPCDVLRQDECRQTPPPSDARCCRSQEACNHFPQDPEQAGCLSEGNGNLNELCSTAEANGRPACRRGLFCSDQLPCPTGNCEFRCLQYCRAQGPGGPVCAEMNADCAFLPGGGGLEHGYCQ